MAVPFMKFTTRKWAVLTSKIDKLFIVIGIIKKNKKHLLAGQSWLRKLTKYS